MATITLKYDARNRSAREALDNLLSLGFFDATATRESGKRGLKTIYVPGKPFAESDDDIRDGRVFRAKDADDLIRQCLES